MSNLTEIERIISNGTTWNNTAPPVAGLQGWLGATELIGLFGLGLILFICWKRKVSFDLMLLSTITMLEILIASWMPEYILWLFIIGGGAVFGMGLIRFIRRR